MDSIVVRRETPADYRRVEHITREAFWNHHVPGCDEHYLVHIMRGDAAFVPELALVAEVDGRPVGNIMYTVSSLCLDTGELRPVLCFGPISVLPEYQGRGVGGALITRSFELACELGYKAVIIYGDPEYYKRFGFDSAERFCIATAHDRYAVPLLAKELVPAALENSAGRFFEAEIYEVNANEAEEFDKGFELKEKLSCLDSQKRFFELCNANRPRKT